MKPKSILKNPWFISISTGLIFFIIGLLFYKTVITTKGDYSPVNVKGNYRVGDNVSGNKTQNFNIDGDLNQYFVLNQEDSKTILRNYNNNNDLIEKYKKELANIKLTETLTYYPSGLKKSEIAPYLLPITFKIRFKSS